MVATILEGLYYDLVSDLDVNEVRDVFRMWDGKDKAPATMVLPSYILDVEEVKYNGKVLEYVEFRKFMNTVTGNKTQQVTSSIGEQWDLRYSSSRDPLCFTTIDDTILIFDACQDDKLMPSKSLGFGSLYPQFKKENDFLIPLAPKHMRYFIQRAKVRAFAELKETSNEEAASEARKQKLAISRQTGKLAIPELFNRRPQYGKSRNRP